MKRREVGAGLATIMLMLMAVYLSAWSPKPKILGYGLHDQKQAVTLLGIPGGNSFFVGLPVHPKLANGRHPVISEKPLCRGPKGFLSNLGSRISEFLALTGTVHAQTCVNCYTDTADDSNFCEPTCPAAGWLRETTSQNVCDGDYFADNYGCGLCMYPEYTGCYNDGCDSSCL